MVRFYKVILLFLIIFTYPAYGTSTSVSSSCLNATSYNFDKYTYDPDFTIKLSSNTINPDLKFKELASKVGACILFQLVF